MIFILTNDVQLKSEIISKIPHPENSLPLLQIRLTSGIIELILKQKYSLSLCVKKLPVSLLTADPAIISIFFSML